MMAHDAGAGGRLIVLGLSHRTAPVEKREKASLPEPAARSALGVLLGDPAVSEAAVLSTCNRTELFAVVADPARAEATLGEALVDHSRITTDELAEASYVHRGRSAARHLFRVAASLDSMVLGESEIQGQVRAARDLAREAGTLGPLLDRTFAQALATGRRVRSQTRVAAGAVSTARRPPRADSPAASAGARPASNRSPTIWARSMSSSRPRTPPGRSSTPTASGARSIATARSC